MDGADVSRWFAEYSSVFAACGRGERPTTDLLEYYAPTVLLTTDDVVVTLRTGDQLAASLQTQVDAMRGAGYDHTEVLHSDVTIVNANTALHVAALARRSQGGHEISRLTATYVITTSSGRPCISLVAVQS